MAKDQPKTEELLDELLLLIDEKDEDDAVSSSLEVNNKPRFLRCNLCPKLFDSQPSLTNHKTFTHPSKTTYAKGE